MSMADTQRRRAVVLAGMLALAVTGAPRSHASTTLTTTFLVSLTINSNCEITANPLNFGSNGVLTSNVNHTTTLSEVPVQTTPAAATYTSTVTASVTF